MAKEIDLRHAVLVGKKFMAVLNALSKLTGEDPNIVLKKAVGYYKTIKEKEGQGYFPAVVKDGKAIRLSEPK